VKERTTFLEGDSSLEDEDFQQLVDESALEKSKLELPRGYLSVSQVNMYMRCGFQYENRYVNNKVAPPGVSMVEGSSMHKSLEVGLREKKDKGTVAPVSVMLDAWHDYWKEGKKEVVDWGDEGAQKFERLVTIRASKFVHMYHADYLPNTNPLDIEKRSYAMVGKHRIPVLGYIDLIDQENTDLINGRVVVDHKVVRSAKSQSDADNDLQLTLYSYMENTRSVRFDCFVKSKLAKIKTVSSHRTQKDIDWMFKIFDNVVLNISAGIFMPGDPTSWVCSKKYCGYYNSCRGK